MNIRKSLKIEKTEDNLFRLLIIEDTKNGFCIFDILESEDLTDLEYWFFNNCCDVHYVFTTEKVFAVTDCLSVWETAEMMI